MYGLINEKEWGGLHNFANVKDLIHSRVKSVLDRLEAYVNSDQMKEQFQVELDRSNPETMPFESCFGKGRLCFSYSVQGEAVLGKLKFQRQFFNGQDERTWQSTLELYFPPYENPYAFIESGREVFAMDRAIHSHEFERQCFNFLMSILYTQIEGPRQEKQG